MKCTWVHPVMFCFSSCSGAVVLAGVQTTGDDELGTTESRPPRLALSPAHVIFYYVYLHVLIVPSKIFYS